MGKKVIGPMVMGQITDSEMLALTATANDGDKYFNKDQQLSVKFVNGIWYATTTVQAEYGVLDENRESGNLTANGWTAINDGTNDWVVGTADPQTGTYSAYISDDSGVSNNYNNTTQQSHLMIDLVIPAGATHIELRFGCKCNGQAGNDDLSLYTAPTTFTPVAGVTPSGVGVTSLGFVQGYTAWTNFVAVLPVSFAGSTMRLIFSWENNNNTQNQPPANIDNITVKHH